MAAEPDDSRADGAPTADDRRSGTLIGPPADTFALVLVFERPEAGQDLLANVLPYLRDAQGRPVGLAVTDAGCMVIGGRAPEVTDGTAHAVVLLAGDAGGCDPGRVRSRLPAGVTVIAEGAGTGLLERYTAGMSAPRGSGDAGPAQPGDPGLTGVADDARRAAAGLRPAAAAPLDEAEPQRQSRGPFRAHQPRRRGRDAASA